MSNLDFVQENFTIGQKNPDLSPQFIFHRKGFRIGGSASVDWREVILSGEGALTLTNALANSLLSLKLFGGTEQTGTPTPDNPIMDIVCNNGVVKVSKNLFDKDNVNVSRGAYLTDNGVYKEDGYSVISDFIKCEPNTSYTVQCYALKANSNLRIHCYDINKNWISLIAKAPCPINQTTSATGTTPSNAAYIKISGNLAYTEESGGGTNGMLELGSTATPYMPYGQIYVDGTTETVKITGKNLYNPSSTWNINASINRNFDPFSLSFPYSIGENRYTYFFKCKPSTKYTISVTTAGDRLFIGGLTSIINPLDYTTSNPFTFDSIIYTATENIPLTYTFTTGANDKMIGIYYALNTIPQNFMLEEGSTATTYEPYFNGGTATAENLFKVGDYQDVQSVIDGGVTRNVGIKVLNGTENWVYLPSGDSTRFYTSIDTINNLGLRLTPLYNTHFLCVSDGRPVAQVPNNAIYTGGGSNQVFIQTNDSGTTVAEFKQFLADQYNAGTPVIIAYPLATATTETVTGQPMNIQAGTNIVEITQASMDDIELEVKYKAIV